MSLLAQMGELLESCQTLEEAYAVIARVAEPLFAGDAGAVYALASSGSVVEAVAVWGNPPPSRSVFSPTDCWALRRGRLHVVQNDDPELRCPHVEEPIAAGLLCGPLVAQTETLGLLHVQVRRRAAGKARAARLAARERLVETLGKQLALALGNIRLRATLREQSARDSLTGLFNRRYMEESLDREVRRATREGYGLGVLLADLDNFKQLNDAFGHAAGDAVLRRIGRFLAGAVRGEDIACRFGGEEFVVILPKASTRGRVSPGGGTPGGDQGGHARRTDRPLSDRHDVGRGGRLPRARNLGRTAHPRRRLGDVPRQRAGSGPGRRRRRIGGPSDRGVRRLRDEGSPLPRS